MSLPGASPPSDQIEDAAPARRHAGAPPAAVERVVQDLQDVGLAPSQVGRVLSFWKRFGGRRATMLALAVTLPLVRYEYTGAAGFDESSVTAGRTPTADEITAQLTERFGLAVGGKSGVAVANALTSDTTPGGNVASRGARSIGRGFKRLFGGGKKPSGR